MKLYGEISKTEQQDDGTIKVWGYASSEAVDSDGETITAEAMKAAIPDYMRWGAVREMHDSKRAAGTAIEAEVLEDGKTWFGAHVVDGEACKKLATGVYKGFSIGGKITDRDELDKTIVTGVKLIEVSLVDRPANPEAVITIMKSEDGEEAPETPEPPATPEPPEAPEAPASDAEPEPAPAPEPESDKDAASADHDLRKYMGEQVWDVATAVQALDSIVYLFSKEQAEIAEYPEQVSALRQVIDGLKAFIASEIMEPDDSADSDAEAMAYAAEAEGLEKAGKEFSSKNAEKIQAIHDHAVSMGATCDSPEKSADTEGLAKADALQKQYDALACEHDELKKSFDVIAAELERLRQEPAPPKAALNSHAVTKAEDSPLTEPVPVIVDASGKVNEAASLIKAVHRAGGSVRH